MLNIDSRYDIKFAHLLYTFFVLWSRDLVLTNTIVVKNTFTFMKNDIKTNFILKYFQHKSWWLGLWRVNIFRSDGWNYSTWVAFNLHTYSITGIHGYDLWLKNIFIFVLIWRFREKKYHHKSDFVFLNKIYI